MPSNAKHPHSKRNYRGNRSRSAQSAGGRLGEQAMKVNDDLHETVRITRDVARAKLDEGREMAEQIERTVEDLVRQRPLTSVLIAAGVGMVLGRMWSHR